MRSWKQFPIYFVQFLNLKPLPCIFFIYYLHAKTWTSRPNENFKPKRIWWYIHGNRMHIFDLPSHVLRSQMGQRTSCISVMRIPHWLRKVNMDIGSPKKIQKPSHYEWIKFAVTSQPNSSFDILQQTTAIKLQLLCWLFNRNFQRRNQTVRQECDRWFKEKWSNPQPILNNNSQ